MAMACGEEGGEKAANSANSEKEEEEGAVTSLNQRVANRE